MDGAIWGLLGTIVGAAATLGVTWISGRQAFGLQRQAASYERLERHHAFQRDTLLQLQDALHDALRMMTRLHLEDVDSAKESGHWGRSFSDEASEGFRVTSRRLSMLIERVEDDALRSDLRRVASAMFQVVMASSQAEAEAALARTYDDGEDVTERIGRVLRSLYKT